MELNAQYQTLGELRKVDEKIDRLRREQARIPAAIEKLELELNQHKTKYQGSQTRFNEVGQLLREAEQELKGKESELERAESKMMEVKTNEEYTAAMKENETRKAAIAKLEDTVLATLTKVEEEKKVLGQAKTTFETIERENRAAVEELHKELARLQGLEKENLEKRAGIAIHLDPSVQKIYDHVNRRIGGVAIVVAENGVCAKCHMALLPQMFNEILAKAKIHQCPGCLRILVTEA